MCMNNYVSTIVSIQLCKLTSGLVTFREVMEFFEAKWAPVTAQVHRQLGDSLSRFIGSVLEALEGSEDYQV